MNDIIKAPMLFNCYKHHLGFIRESISRVKDEADLTELSIHLLLTGTSVMDIYTGNLSPVEIARQIKECLKKEKHFSYDNYSQWLEEHFNYRIVFIADGSSWILRKGDFDKNYIHIHPARNSLFVFRTNATTLKTATAVIAFCNIYYQNPADISVINKVRKDFLYLSPIQTETTKSAVVRVVNILKWS